jgi:multiple sugar transport system substrate-binding protein
MKIMRRVPVVAAMAVLASTVLVACGGDDNGGSSSGDGGGSKITLWTQEDVQARIEKTKEIAADYTAKTGTEVEVVPVAEDQFSQLITSAAGSGELPDVIAALGLSGVNLLSSNQLLDTDMATKIVGDLGADTFSPRALSLTQDPDGTQLAVPSDGWAQLLFYRKDLFDAAGLAPPTTYDAIEQAAKTLDSDAVAGITAATAPGDSFTQQTFEHVALANNCQLTNDAGDITLTSKECVDSFGWYGDLMKQYGPAGNQDVDTTRATYFAGKAAMLIWSSYLLDELAGLRDDALPTCEKCKDDPRWLSDNTGIVSAIQGPDGSQPAQYGEITSWTIPTGADPATADFIEYMMDERYVDWLALAPEGKVPVRKGTAADPTKFIDAWPKLKTGEDRKAPLDSLYDAQTIKAIADSPDTFQRWGFEQGQGALAGAMLSELPVPKALSDEIGGGLSAQDAAAQAQDDVQRIADSLPG